MNSSVGKCFHLRSFWLHSEIVWAWLSGMRTRMVAALSAHVLQTEISLSKRPKATLMMMRLCCGQGEP